MKPLILINFKTYPESSGNKALKLAKKLSKVRSKQFEIGISPSILTTKEIAQKTKLPVFAQHADRINYGAHTGGIPVDELRDIGVTGVLLNHSEYKIPLSYLKDIVNLCRQNWLKTIVCASSLPEAKRILEFKPDYLAYEPQQLIGGNISVTSADPKIIQELVHVTHKLSFGTQVLCGAGIHSKEDLHAALGLGANGILLSHAVCSAENPKKFLKEMIK
jgi:triosephosphate isomerase